MAVNQNLGMTVRENVPEIAGGAVGIGLPVTLRETVDVRNGQAVSLLGEPGSLLARLTSPSVSWGLGAGALTGALWWADVGGDTLKDFYMAHTVTAIPSGAVSALMPKEASGGGGSGQTRSLTRQSTTSSTSSSTDGEKPPKQEKAPKA